MNLNETNYISAQFLSINVDEYFHIGNIILSV